MCFRENTKNINLHYHIAYDDQTWEGGDIEWEAVTHKVTRFFNQVV